MPSLLSERPARPPYLSPAVTVQSGHNATESAPLFLGAQESDSTPSTRLNEVSSPAELEFSESVERYSHAYRAREQRTKPTCDAASWYLLLGSPALRSSPMICSIMLTSRKRPPLSKICFLDEKGCLRRGDDGTLLLVQPVLGTSRGPQRPPTSWSASWTIPEQSSSSSLLLATLQLLERSAIRGAFKLVKVELFNMGS